MDLSNRSQSARRSSSTASNSNTGAANTAHQRRADQATAASLQLLLREDPLLQELASNRTDPFEYAAALLNDDATAASSAQQRADLALQDVERKLALVESLAVKLSRTSPEAVAGHLLRLHGHAVHKEEHVKDETTNAITNTSSAAATTTTLQAIRDRADRLERQAETLETVAKRVEGSLQRGLTRMDSTCTRLERVLQISSTLKRILRWQFENRKLQNYDLEDLRDLTRAAASVAVLQDLLKSTTTTTTNDDSSANNIHVVQELRPPAQQTATAVRAAADALLQTSQIPQLAATLQVYYHLGELPSAVWKAVNDAHRQAEAISRELWNPVTMANVAEQIKKLGKTSSSGGSNPRQRQRQIRAQAANDWAMGIAQAATQVRNLQRVLSRKTDPVKRQVYLEVVAQAPIPAEYENVADSTAAGGNNNSNSNKTTRTNFSLFQLFWARLCESLAMTIQSILTYENGKLLPDVAALYPAVRASCLELMSQLQETASSSTTGSGSAMASHLEDATTSETAGILGGIAALEEDVETFNNNNNNPQAADSWTRPDATTASAKTTLHSSSGTLPSHSASAASLSAIFASTEWRDLQDRGLHQLEQSFLLSVRERLDAPLQFMFPENVTLDDNGVAISTGMTLLPSKYDVQRFDENIRQELALADPREGGGDLSAVTMIAECVVGMINDFCLRARNATTGAGETGYLNGWNMTESLQHDRKVVAILYTLGNYLKNAPYKTFVSPYRPTILPQHEEAASLCQQALLPAREAIDQMVQSTVLHPLCRALNRQIATVLSNILHHGVYLASNSSDMAPESAFVQKHLAPVFDLVAQNLLNKFPPPYSAKIAATLSTFTIYTFVSNLSLVRPLGESARLHMTQDLADLELTLEQFVGKSGGGLALNLIDGGKPYAELRAVRQMLFWTGLEMTNAEATDVAKSLLREVWIKDVRPSTVFHYLFASAPSLLSSPHHTKRMKAEEYVQTLVPLNGSVEEDDAWMTVVTCCDAYQQRATSSVANLDGDARVAQIVLTLGPELLRRRRY